ncbi:MAG TPA: GAF domain-containing protein, partial [Thermoanaerobaculia bacterium]|nr:GAF domain-containing protein [Thermoanaerobaculia bacterium]
MAEDIEGLSRNAEASALAELALCENLSQTSGWAARWSVELSGADAALLWAPDTVHPIFLCIGAHGEGTKTFLRRSVPRDTGVVHDLLRDRRATVLERSDVALSNDPWLKDLPGTTQTVIAVPLEAEGLVVGLLALIFARRPQTQATLSRLDGFLRQASPALGRALRAERKTVGMLHAIERLTNLYDLSKAFGSTIDLAELNALIARKAADFGVAEIASLWMLEGEEVTLAATAVNENYEVQSPPEAVGSSLVGDVLAERETFRRNRIPGDDPIAQEDPAYPVHSVLALPLIEDETPAGALVLANKRGRHPEFTPEDEELLADLGRQAVRALRNARQYEAEKKVAELDALLAISQEITATLDLDRVMQSIVNGSAALIQYDRCAISILDRGRLRLGAVSGMAELDRKSPEARRTEELLSWVFLSGSNVNVTLQEDGRLIADRPETEEKFRAFFQETGLKAFYGALLTDEEGKLGVLGFECREPIVFDEETRDLLQILVNQATVAVRNAQLYRQVPLSGFWKPMLEKRRRLSEIPRQRRRVWVAGALVAAVVLFLVPWRLRVGGPARILPGRRTVVTAGVDGIIKAVLHREGDTVSANEVIATLEDESYQAALADARSAYQIAASEVARAREAGNAAAMFEAQSRRDELASRINMEAEHLARTSLRAPAAGVIVTPRLEERVGQNLVRGAELCVVADVGTVTAEVAVPEADASLIRSGQTADLKWNPYPTRTFRGQVDRVGARIREEGGDRFVIAEVALANADG